MMWEDIRDCDTCMNNQGSHCSARSCRDGDGYDPGPEKRCRCGGKLSEIRVHNGRRYRHCYSCHFEFFEEVE